jgi:hypothetical protein
MLGLTHPIHQKMTTMSIRRILAIENPIEIEIGENVTSLIENMTIQTTTVVKTLTIDGDDGKREKRRAKSGERNDRPANGVDMITISTTAVMENPHRTVRQLNEDESTGKTRRSIEWRKS